MASRLTTCAVPRARMRANEQPHQEPRLGKVAAVLYGPLPLSIIDDLSSQLTYLKKNSNHSLQTASLLEAKQPTASKKIRYTRPQLYRIGEVMLRAGRGLVVPESVRNFNALLGVAHQKSAIHRGPFNADGKPTSHSSALSQHRD